MNWSLTGAILMALAVGLGAFGAHGLRDRLDAYSMSVYEKAVFYHFIHSLGLLIVSYLPKTGTFSMSAASFVCALLLAGVDHLLGKPVPAGRYRQPLAGRHHPHRRPQLHRRLAPARLVQHSPVGPVSPNRIRRLLRTPTGVR